MGEEREEAGGFDWAGSEDLTSLSTDELKAHLGEFQEEERSVSYRRRVLQGRIDLVRAELVRRGDVVASPEELARVLMGDPQGPGSGTREESGGP
jgi:hypothetical protein